MSKGSSSPSRITSFALVTLLLSVSCSKHALTPLPKEQAQQQAIPAPSISADGLPSSASRVISLPMGFTRDTGDLDAMKKRRQIRALVILNPIGFFYAKGLPRGIMFEALEAF